MTKTDELLAVLAMPEREQEEWLSSRVYYPPKDKHDLRSWGAWWRETKADLAFCLRDEVGQGKFVNGIIEVFEHLYKYSDYKSVMMWLSSKECQPIHWIIAALIAALIAKHEHKWVDATNEMVKGGEVCLECGAIRAKKLARKELTDGN